MAQLIAPKLRLGICNLLLRFYTLLKTTIVLVAFYPALSWADTIVVESGDSLTDVIVSASDNDMIVFESDDTFDVGFIRVENKSLTLTSADGFTPSIDGTLYFDGIDFPELKIVGLSVEEVLVRESVSLHVENSTLNQISKSEGFFENAGDRPTELHLDNIRVGSVHVGGLVEGVITDSTLETLDWSGGRFSSPELSSNLDVKNTTITGTLVPTAGPAGSLRGEAVEIRGRVNATFDNTTMGFDGDVGPSPSVRAFQIFADDGLIEITNSKLYWELSMWSRSASDSIIVNVRDSEVAQVFNRGSGLALLNIEDSVITGAIDSFSPTVENWAEGPLGSAKANIVINRTQIFGAVEKREGSIFLENSIVRDNPLRSRLERNGIETTTFFNSGYIKAVNVTVTGFENAISSQLVLDQFENMLLVGNENDFQRDSIAGTISNSLLSKELPGVSDVNGNTVGAPVVDDNYNLLVGSIGIDAGSNDAVGIDATDINGCMRLQDGDLNGVATVDVGASETIVEGSNQVCERTVVEGSEQGDDAGQIDGSSPVSLNSWGSGFNATFEYVVLDTDTVNGILDTWKLEISGADSFQFSSAWINSGYNGPIQSIQEGNLYVITNENVGFVDQRMVGDKITFTLQGQQTGFENADISIRFVSLTEPDNDVDAVPTCDNATPISLPIIFDGRGSFCWEVTGDISYVNSWNGASVSVNDSDYSNQWSNSFPARIGGRYFIMYVGNSDFSHFEMY